MSDVVHPNIGRRVLVNYDNYGEYATIVAYRESEVSPTSHYQVHGETSGNVFWLGDWEIDFLIDYDSREETLTHVHRVRDLMMEVVSKLKERARHHDDSKFREPEKSVFDLVSPRLKTLTYGSDEYKAALKDMGVALIHHYAHNSHHPQHYANGIDGMSLLDLMEMLPDWKAAGERTDGGEVKQSLVINRDRFGLSDQLANILENTVKEMGW